MVHPKYNYSILNVCSSNVQNVEPLAFILDYIWGLMVSLFYTQNGSSADAVFILTHNTDVCLR